MTTRNRKPILTGGRIESPEADDAIPEGMCLRCGFMGPHATPDDCITVLRNRIAELEFSPREKRAC